MKNVAISIFQVAATALVCCFAIHSARAQAITQNITLQPGWNAVWLEVQPSANRTDTIFSNLPVASVWTRAERLSSVEFIQDPSEEAFNQSGWLGWFHPSRPDAFLGNLFAVHANRAYLIKVNNSTPVNWSVVGRPSLRRLSWVPDSYNLRGLPVDPASPPTFLNFLRPSKAHYDAAAGQLQSIYRLNSASGQWQLVSPGETVQSGAAYWIYSRGASDYVAPLVVGVDSGDGLDFGAELTEAGLRLANHLAAPVNASVREVGGPGSSILSYYQFDPVLGGRWPALPNPLAITLPTAANAQVRLAARRQNLTGSTYQSVLEVRDGAGTRLLVPILVEKSPATGAAALGLAAAAAPSNPLAGLWVGTATLDAVSEPHTANPTNATPTKSQLSLRLLVHLDASGQARLLKEVVQMWRNGTSTNDASGNAVTDKPGEYVLLTDDTRLPMFSGATVRDGQSVGRRISSIGYDFPSNSSNNFLNLSGSFAIGQSLNGTLTLPYDYATNPFKHKYHPDHDNLTNRFDGPAIESYTTTRQIRFDFATSPPAGVPPVADFGFNQMGGTYRETISGIHKHPIHVRGTFQLARVSSIPELNPSPTP
jgi:hypothetical protein